MHFIDCVHVMLSGGLSGQNSIDDPRLPESPSVAALFRDGALSPRQVER